MCFFLETRNRECSGFGGHFYDREKAGGKGIMVRVIFCHPVSVPTHAELSQLSKEIDTALRH